MEYTASHKHSFKWALTDDRLHYDIPDFSFDSTTTPISNCFFGIKKQAWGTFVADVKLEIKFPGIVLNKLFLVFQIFCGIILLRIKGLKKKHSSKNTAKYKDFTKPKCTSSGFFFSQSDFALKEF